MKTFFIVFRNTRNPSSSNALCSASLEMFSLETLKGTSSPGESLLQMSKLLVKEPKVSSADRYIVWETENQHEASIHGNKKMIGDGNINSVFSRLQVTLFFHSLAGGATTTTTTLEGFLLFFL